MSCILRAFGSDFDINAFVGSTYLIVDSFWLKDEKRFPNSATIQTVNNSSGIRIVASDADFSELHKQIEETIIFLGENQEEIMKLTSFPGVEGAALDFGVSPHPSGWSSFAFPPALLLLTGSISLSLCLSVYPTSEESEG